MSNLKKIKINHHVSEGLAYRSNLPFPHCVIDGLWDSRLLQAIAKEFDEFNDWDGEKNFVGSVGKKYCGTLERLPEKTKALIQFCCSTEFLCFLESVTGEKSLIPDPYLEGGGMHSTTSPGFLRMHVDFNWHKKLALYRRLNVLIYLNQDWSEGWGGDLCLAKPEGASINITKNIYPELNRTVIFTTTSETYHGHPEHLSSPAGVSRKSIALYYYQSSNADPRAINIKRLGTDYRDTNMKQLGNSLSIRVLKNCLRRIQRTLAS